MTNNAIVEDRLTRLQQVVNQFSAEREWEKFHTLKNLSMALSVEASELVEIFQWENVNLSIDEMPQSKKAAIAHEVADVFIYLLRFCTVAKIDLIEAARDKLEVNASKYPVGTSKGSSKKYDEKS